MSDSFQDAPINKSAKPNKTLLSKKVWNDCWVSLRSTQPTDYGQVHLLQQDKLLIGMHTDMRGAFPGGKLNSMIAGALDCIMGDEKGLIAELDAYRSKRKARV